MGKIFQDAPDLFTEAGKEEYRLSLVLTVRDIDSLWRMAAARALELTGLGQSEVEDVIGPCEDPQVSDCLAMLFTPRPVAGCAFKSISIEKMEPQSVRKNQKSRVRLRTQNDWDAMLPEHSRR